MRGLFSGGTLCYESLVILSRLLGPVCSNTPIDKALGPARARRQPTSASTSARRSTPRAGPTR